MSTVTLYESNADSIYIQLDDGPTWDLGPCTPDLAGRFAADAEAWVSGDWEPTTGDGQTQATSDGLTPVATWRPSAGVTLLVDSDRVGGSQQDYIGRLA